MRKKNVPRFIKMNLGSLVGENKADKERSKDFLVEMSHRRQKQELGLHF